MNEPDFGAFTALWQQEPAEEEVRIFRKLARRTSRHARLLRYAETWFGMALAAGTVAVFLYAPGVLTGLLAALLIFAMLWSAWQRHRLDDAAAQVGRANRHDLLESSERSARAALKRSTIGMVGAAPGGLATVALLDLAAHGGDAGTWFADLPATLGSQSILVSVSIVTAVTAAAWRHNRRLHRELGRIAELRAAYREEDLLDRILVERAETGK